MRRNFIKHSPVLPPDSFGDCAEGFLIKSGLPHHELTKTWSSSEDDISEIVGNDPGNIAKFTFMMSTPIILGDALYHAREMKSAPAEGGPFAVAVITSAAVVGALSIKFLLNYLKKNGFKLFAIYQFIVGSLVIAIYFCGDG